MAKTKRFTGKVVEIHDADTYKVEIDLGFYVVVKQWLRLRGLDAQELDQERGAEATAFVREMMPEGTTIEMDVELVKTREGGEDYKWTFRRFVADVTLPGGTDLAGLIRKQGFEKSKASVGTAVGDLWPGDPVLGKVITQSANTMQTERACTICGCDTFKVKARCRCWRNDMTITCRQCYSMYDFCPTGERHGGAR